MTRKAPTYGPNEQKAIEALPGILAYVNDVLTFAETLRGTKVRQDDRVADMLMHFAFRQWEHLDCIRILGLKRDVQLIARSVIEGIALLSWAYGDPVTRTARVDQWWKFLYITEWRAKYKGRRKPSDKKELEAYESFMKEFKEAAGT